MTDTDIKKSLKEYKKQLISLMGKDALMSTELTKMGKKLFGKKYLGTYAQDKFPMGLNGYCINNTDLDGEPGTHWVALVFEPKTCYVYDSFGRTTERLLPVLDKRFHAKNFVTIDSETKPEQYGDTQICGILSLSFLLCCDTYGVKKTIKVI